MMKSPSGHVEGLAQVVGSCALSQIGPQRFHDLLAVEAVTPAQREQLD
jgi:hypothetical protein